MITMHVMPRSTVTPKHPTVTGALQTFGIYNYFHTLPIVGRHVSTAGRLHPGDLRRPATPVGSRFPWWAPLQLA
jgi:hypothetical protein